MVAASQLNVACRAPSSACEPRWTLEMVAAVEVAVVRSRPTAAAGPAPAAVLALTCSTSQ